MSLKRNGNKAPNHTKERRKTHTKKRIARTPKTQKRRECPPTTPKHREGEQLPQTKPERI